jgi:hypothetical protein
MVRAGVPEKVAMQISGHKAHSVFNRYNIVSERDLEDAARKIDQRQKEAARMRTQSGSTGNFATSRSAPVCRFLLVAAKRFEEPRLCGNPEPSLAS